MGSHDFIEEAHDADVDGIIFEDLDHICENIANGSNLQQWAYKKFVELVEYNVKSTALFVDFVNCLGVKPRGIRLDYPVNLAYTSQRCSHCGFPHEDNREDK